MEQNKLTETPDKERSHENFERSLSKVSGRTSYKIRPCEFVPHLEVSLAAKIGDMLHHLDLLRGLDNAALHHSIVQSRRCITL